MSTKKPEKLPLGLQPWDPANGLRVGGITGAVVGAIVMAVVGVANIWLMVVPALIGAVVGYWSEKRKQG